MVSDLDERVAAIASRGIEPSERETYGDGVRKMIYRDPDGNEIGFGGGRPPNPPRPAPRPAAAAPAPARARR